MLRLTELGVKESLQNKESPSPKNGIPFTLGMAAVVILEQYMNKETGGDKAA